MSFFSPPHPSKKRKRNEKTVVYKKIKTNKKKYFCSYFDKSVSWL